MNTSKGSQKGSVRPHIWCFTTYFTEGFPYTIIRTISSVFFRDRGMSLEAIGLTSLFGLPWVLKFLWSPQVDEFGTKRKWLLITQGLLAGLILLTAFFTLHSQAVQAIAVLFFFAAFVAATHDIAIDGYYMEALDKDGQAKFVGYRVMAYRIAMMTGTGVIVTIGTLISWFWAFFASGVIMTLFWFFHFSRLPSPEIEKRPFSSLIRSLVSSRFILCALIMGAIITALRFFLASSQYRAMRETFPIFNKISFSGWIGIMLFSSLILVLLLRKQIRAWILRTPDSFYAKAFLTFMDREKIGTVLAFIILIRTGEFMLSSMASPFMVDLGIKVHYGWISGGVGLPCSIAGAMLGGWMIARYTLRKMIWPFLLAQNFTNVIYMFLALSLSDQILMNTGATDPASIGITNLAAVAGVHGFDQFAGGLGTAVLMTYLMKICLPEYKAAHYAIGTALMSVSGLYAGVLSGFMASWLGYGYFFGISFLMSIPGMILIFFVPLFEQDDR